MCVRPARARARVRVCVWRCASVDTTGDGKEERDEGARAGAHGVPLVPTDVLYASAAMCVRARLRPVTVRACVRTAAVR